ncbi:MAG TPA: hypothetical protein VLX91_06820 [Candidatus Acidoferrales bacterium]|nr:hypothetical protein [Candidatus Acidoferrales bacterium]
MRCSFLREAQVKSCGACEFKKMIAQNPIKSENETDERCSSIGYTSCPWMKQLHEESPSQSRCPFLQESLAQYCSGESVVKYIPYSEPNLSRCGTSSHRYCESFLNISHLDLRKLHQAATPDLNSEDDGPWSVEGIQTTGWHFYSANHMWAEIDEEGTCHIGVDPFFTRVVGKVEKLAFAPTSGKHLAGAVITVNGADLPMVFPNHIDVKATNSLLRTKPDKIISDPYTFGWLFEGVAARMQGETDIRHGLIRGSDARTWMKNEATKLSELLREKLVDAAGNEARLAADGGIFSSELSRNLNKEELVILYNEFFSSRR